VEARRWSGDGSTVAWWWFESDSVVVRCCLGVAWGAQWWFVDGLVVARQWSKGGSIVVWWWFGVNWWWFDGGPVLAWWWFSGLRRKKSNLEND
jgi:hypothetical protein